MAVGNTSCTVARTEDVSALAASTQRPQEISSTVIKDFQRDGVIIMRGAFPEWVEPLRDGLQRNLDPQNFAFPCESTSGDEPGRFFDSYCNWQLIPTPASHSRLTQHLSQRNSCKVRLRSYSTNTHSLRTWNPKGHALAP